jgi:hypothetical protein
MAGGESTDLPAGFFSEHDHSTATLIAHARGVRDGARPGQGRWVDFLR